MGGDYQRIYDEEAALYDRLVSAEDTEGRLGPALAGLCALDGRRVLEVGAGTGRITRLLLERGARVVALDRAAAMLQVARARGGPGALQLVHADARRLPVAARWADLAIAGWVFGHFRSWLADGWRDEIGAALDAMQRALAPSGTLAIIETLGTGVEVAGPPTPALAEYYAWMEGARGLERRVLRTDYAFDSVEAAAETCGAFFGPEMAARIRARGWRRVPEFTGLWSSAPVRA